MTTRSWTDYDDAVALDLPRMSEGDALAALVSRDDEPLPEDDPTVDHMPTIEARYA